MSFKFLSLLALFPLVGQADHHEGGHDERPNILYIMSDDHAAHWISASGSRLTETRKRVGDDGSHFPATGKVIQEFWDYDEKDREKDRLISNKYLKRREAELKAGKRNIFTIKGHVDASLKEKK